MFPSQKAASFSFNTHHGGNRGRSIQKQMQQQLTPRQQQNVIKQPTNFLNVRNKEQKRQKLVQRLRGSVQHVAITRTLQSVGSNNLVSKNYLISVLSGTSQTDDTLAFTLTIPHQPNQQARFLEVNSLFHSVLNVIELNGQSATQIASTFQLHCDQLSGFIDQNGLDTKSVSVAYQRPQSVMPATNFNGVNVVWKSQKSYAWDITNITVLNFRVRYTGSKGKTLVTFPVTRPIVVAATVTSVIM